MLLENQKKPLKQYQRGIRRDLGLFAPDCYSLSPVFHLPCNVGTQSAFLKHAFLQSDTKDTWGNCAKVEVNVVHPFPIVCKARNNIAEGSKLCQAAWP